MSSTNEKRDKHLEELLLVSIEIDKKVRQQRVHTNNLQKLAFLAREGKTDTKEFKELNQRVHNPTVVDFGDEVAKLCNLVAKINKLKRR